MDEELPGSPDDDMSSPQDYTLASPHDLLDPDVSPQSGGDASDIELDV